VTKENQSSITMC